MKATLFIATLSAGGAERVASLLANEWSGYDDLEVSIILLFNDTVFYPINPAVTVRCLGLRPNKSPLQRLIGIFRSMYAFRRAIQDEQADFVLSFMNKYNVFCLISLFWSNIPIIVAERDSPTEKLPPIRAVLRKLTYRFARGATVQSNDARIFIERETGLERIAVLPNPISQWPAAHNRHPEKIILNVGRLVKKKGQADLLHAFAALEAPDWSLVFCGDGPLRPELELLAVHLGVAERVIFAGTVTDVSVWLARAGIFAFPSYWEGFPNALAEAMVSGVPVVSYDCPTGPAEMISHGKNGLLVSVGDIQGFSNCLSTLVNDSAAANSLSKQAALIADELDVVTVSKCYFDFCTDSIG